MTSDVRASTATMTLAYSVLVVVGLASLTPGTATALTVSGTVTCGDCLGGVGIQARQGGADGALISAIGLPSPGSFSLFLPIDAGPVTLLGFRDDALDGAPNPDGPPPVAVVVVVGSDAIEGVVLELGVSSSATVTVSGTATCPDCAGGLLLSLHREQPYYGPIVVQVGLTSPGPFSVAVPSGSGPLWAVLQRDTDSDGVADPGAGGAEFVGNPLVLDGSPAANVDIVLPALPQATVTLKGVVSCEDCGGIGLVVHGDGGLDGPLLARISLFGPGTYSLVVPTGVLSVSVFVFRDEDLDGVPDTGVPTAFAGNPVAVVSPETDGVDLELGPPTLATIAVHGTVSCGDCTGVGLQILGLGDREGQVLARATALSPGPYSVALPVGLGSVRLVGFRDADLDGEPDPGAGVNVASVDPVEVGFEAVAGVNVTITALPPAAVSLSGELLCADCEGGVGLRFAHGDGGGTVMSVSLLAPGSWSVKLPIDVPTVSVFGFRDQDLDGAADEGGSEVAYGANPVLLGGQPVGGLDLDLGQTGPKKLTLSGVVLCPGCGPVGLRLHQGTNANGPVVQAVTLLGPGPFAMQVPAGLGSVSLFGFRDSDLDLEPDPGSVQVQATPATVDVGDSAVTGLVVTLEPEVTAGVKLSGTIVCSSCGPVGVAVHLESSGADVPLASGTLLGPGAFQLSLPSQTGPVYAFGYHDSDLNGLADPGLPAVASALNPIYVGDSDVAGVTLVLGAGPKATIRIAGTVVCSTCAGGVRVSLHGQDGLGSVPLSTLSLLAPGPWSADVPVALGPVYVAAHRDDDQDGQPDSDALGTAYAGNPLTVGLTDLDGISIDLDEVAQAEVDSAEVGGGDSPTAVELVAEQPEIADVGAPEPPTEVEQDVGGPVPSDVSDVLEPGEVFEPDGQDTGGTTLGDVGDAEAAPDELDAAEGSEDGASGPSAPPSTDGGCTTAPSPVNVWVLWAIVGYWGRLRYRRAASRRASPARE